MRGSKLDHIRRGLLAVTRSDTGIYFGSVVTVDPVKHVVDVMPEMEEGQVWTDVPYQPLTGKVEGEWHDPAVGAAVVVLQDALGRRRVIGPPEAFVEWHLVSSSARVRLDLKKNQFTIIVDGGVSVTVNGSEVTVDNATKTQINSGEVHIDKASLVQINGGSHPAMRGDTFETWYTTVKAAFDAHVQAGPSGPPTTQLPAFDSGILDPTVLLD